MSSILADTHRLPPSSWGKPFSKEPPISPKTVDPTPPASPTDVSPKVDTFDAVAKQDSQVSVAEQVALAMGIPEIVVQMAKDFQLLEHGTNFADASELYAAAEDLLNHPHKQAYIGKKLYEHAEKQKKTLSKDLIESKDRKEHSTAKDSVSPSAEMLMDKVKRLAHENHKLRQRKMCRECKKVDLASSGVTFLPCGHFITCETCSEKFDNCPACSKSIMGTVRTFLS